MDHSPGFLKLVNEARPAVSEITIEQARHRLASNPQAVLVDVREDQEWDKSHAVEAMHLGRGIFERDLERLFPNPSREIVLYCGGGYRSVLVAASARKMGYPNVHSVIGGFRAMVKAQWPMIGQQAGR